MRACLSLYLLVVGLSCLSCCCAALAAAAMPLKELYPVYWTVGGANTSAFALNGSVNVAQYGIKPNNWSHCGGLGGAWPTLGVNAVGALVPTTNGGVPQAANLTLHLDQVRTNVAASIPDPDWAGLASFDFESWTPIFDDNNQTIEWHNVRTQNYSKQIVRAKHKDWTEQQIEVAAKSEFETAATDMMVKTLNAASALRPRAHFGFYGMPYGSFAPTPTNRAQALRDAKQMQPIWEASGALYPCIYMGVGGGRGPEPPKATAAAVRLFRVNATVEVGLAAARMVSGTRKPVYPFGWEMYQSGGIGASLLDPVDLMNNLLAPYNAGADGVIVWGSVGFFPPPHVAGPTLPQYFEYIRDHTGPMVKAFEKKVKACATKQCSGHGRCKSVPTAATAAAGTGDGCECFAGFTGPACAGEQ